MQLFFEPHIEKGLLTLSETTSRHSIQVLRMKENDMLHLVDGKGGSTIATIKSADKKRTTVQIDTITWHDEPSKKIHLAIAFTKNPSRMEWLLEKITEIGITSIIPIITQRTEKLHIKKERFENIVISAMLQSKQYYLPKILEPIAFNDCMEQYKNIPQKYIAHCIEGQAKQNITTYTNETIICIGPEGDFTPVEIDKAINAGFMPVTLGETRLRTETAGLVAVTLLNHL